MKSAFPHTLGFEWLKIELFLESEPCTKYVKEGVTAQV